MALEPRDSSLQSTRLALLAALVDGDLGFARRAAKSLLADGYTFDDLADALFAPLQGELGARWATGDLGIADEHAASAVVGDLIRSLGTVEEPPAGPKVVVVTPELDLHALGAQVIAASLTLEGYRTVLLGVSVPAPDLGEFVAIHEPVALALSCSIPAALASAARSMAVVHEHGVPVVSGGRAWRADEWAGRLGVDALARSGRAAVDVIGDWNDEPPAGLRPVPEPIAERQSLVARTAELIAGAVAVAGPLAERPDRLADELTRVLHAVESATLVDDVALLVEHLEWLDEAGPVHGIPLDSIHAGIDALVDALDGELARLGSMLANAERARVARPSGQSRSS